MSGLSRVRKALSRVPAESGGIALNLVGMGSWLSAMCELHPALQPAYWPGSVVVVSLACTIFAAIFLQAVLHTLTFVASSRSRSSAARLVVSSWG